MASKPSIPKGTRDFHQGGKRQYIIQIIKSNFEKFSTHRNAFIRKLETLMGKYGEEEATV
jgi:hypothetical protein